MKFPPERSFMNFIFFLRVAKQEDPAASEQNLSSLSRASVCPRSGRDGEKTVRQMDDAFDTVKNQRVRAANATASRFPGRYICPVCQTEVAYASGAYVSAHFRHCRGTDHEQCERYSRNFHVEVPLARHEWEHLDAVLISQTYASQGQPFVSLAVRFRPAYAVKSVTFVSGRNSTPYFVHHNLRQQYFRISEAEENYLVKAQLPAGECESHIVEGFGPNPAVFRASEREAVRLPCHRILRPGGHLVISKLSLQPLFHSSLLAESRPTIPGLYATLIRIPEDPIGKSAIISSPSWLGDGLVACYLCFPCSVGGV